MIANQPSKNKQNSKHKHSAKFQIRNYQISSKLFALCLLSLILSLVIGIPNYWHNGGDVIFPARRFYFAFSGLAAILGYIFLKINKEPFSLDYRVFSFGLVFVFFTSWLHNDYGLIQAPDGRSIILLLGLLFSLYLFFSNKVNISLLAISTLSYLVISFLIASDGRTITSDDHLTFLHRLQLLKTNFPHIPNYDALWNAGYDQRYYFATGALAFYFFSYPLVAFFEPQSVYNFCILFVTLVLPFFSVYFATYTLSKNRNASWIAALLALTPCTEWYRWAYQYGTMGFICSASLVPSVLALSLKVLNVKDKFRFDQAILLVVLFTLMLFWSASGLIFLPLIAIALVMVFTHKLLSKNHVILVLALLLIINLPWISVFWSVSNVGKFVSAEKQDSEYAQHHINETIGEKPITKKKKFRHKSKDFDFISSIKELPTKFANYNLIILIFAIPGLFLLNRRITFGFVCISFWLIFMGGFLVEVKPQFELDRMLTILALVSCIPAGLAISTATKRIEERNFFTIISSVVIFSFIFTTPLSAAKVFYNRTNLKIFFTSNFTPDLIAALKKYDDGGRALFSGCIVHEIDGGHLAPFTELSDVPLIASSPVHNLWWYTQVFPQIYLKDNKVGIDKYLNNYNVTTLFAHEPTWKKYFEKHSNEFDYVDNVNQFRVYKRKNYQNNYFYQGSGELLEQDNNHVTLKIDKNNTVIKFKYYDFLESSACKLSPYNLDTGDKLIKIDSCPSYPTQIKIKSKAAWKRIKF